MYPFATRPAAALALLLPLLLLITTETQARSRGSFSSDLTTSFTIGTVTIQLPVPADLTGQYTLQLDSGVSVSLDLVQDSSGDIVGMATVHTAAGSFGPFEVEGRGRSYGSKSRFKLEGEFEAEGQSSDWARSEDDDDDDDSDDDDEGDDDSDSEEEELEIELEISGCSSTDGTFTVKVEIEADGISGLEGEFRTTLSGGSTNTATSSTLVIGDGQSYAEDNGREMESERLVTLDGAILGTAEAEQKGCTSRVKFEAEVEDGDDVEVKMYGYVSGTAFTPICAKVEIGKGRVKVPGTAITVQASAFAAIAEQDDDSD